MYIMDIIFNIRKQQKIMSRTKMLSVNPWISRELQDRNVYFKRCTVGEVYSIWYKYLFYRKVFFSKRSFLAFHRFNIKTWLKWCTFEAPPSDSSPSPHFLNHFRKQSVEIIFTSPCTNRWKRSWLLLLEQRTANSTQGITFTASKTHIRKVSEVSSEA